MFWLRKTSIPYTLLRILYNGNKAIFKRAKSSGDPFTLIDPVTLMRKTVGRETGVKASGGIRNLNQTLAMIKSGASRIDTSRSVAIIDKPIKCYDK